ncbi:hypothetical protein [Jeotgalibacillus alimentarius]|uniref:hypothetical protein n=1 Tax=Jeotgalibacillus alimentarius TaxID=135826 RepID=UPI0005977CD6|nr:hypothetical protein [Jeotgalibacillus alimentarius]
MECWITTFQKEGFFRKHIFKDTIFSTLSRLHSIYLSEEVVKETISLLKPSEQGTKPDNYKEYNKDYNDVILQFDELKKELREGQHTPAKKEQNNTLLWLMGAVIAILLMVTIVTNITSQPDYKDYSYEEDPYILEDEADAEGLISEEFNSESEETANNSSSQKSIESFQDSFEDQDESYDTYEDDLSYYEEPVTENDSSVEESAEKIYTADVAEESPAGSNTESIQTSNGTFTVGSTKEQVQAVMGTPTSIESILNMWRYDMSSIDFDDQDRVIGWNDLSNNLNYSFPTNSAAEIITTGSTKEEVVAVMGVPSSIEPILNNWRYDMSSIDFNDQDQVVGWNDLSNNLIIGISTNMAASTFTLGSSKEEVLSAMGTPSSIEPILNTWRYEMSSVDFDDQDQVVGRNDLSNNLNIR